MDTMQVVLPAGAVAGGPLQIMTPGGPMMVQVPLGIQEGATFMVQVPAQPPMAQAAAVAVPAASMAEPCNLMMPVAAQPLVATGVVVAPVAAQPNLTFERISAQHKCQFCGEQGFTKVSASPRPSPFWAHPRLTLAPPAPRSTIRASAPISCAAPPSSSAAGWGAA